ncbi:MAG: class I SAM-dependent methyltransferase [Pseudanabaenaceae cyanobacterium SKYGB_i_bin29]|nr:class I SAM-dependent methyltransferase [Pseudanabaenaceae cyanobacterium SKYG29]MDW8422353.1 class I SAM-dependent methyltransferase [Pseudanabaenaceae cyanobacterium SKYGB_i_bin29]
MTPNVASNLVNALLSYKPIASWAKQQARQMMINRAAQIGIDWHDRVAQLQKHDLEAALAKVRNPQVKYPGYYLRSFHGYEYGNLGWEPALEVEVAAYAVHSRIWSKTGEKGGDAQLRASYHQQLFPRLANPQRILDVGCSVGMSTRAMQAVYPQAEVIGLDLSPYFLAIAQLEPSPIQWVHAPAEQTGLPDRSFDLVSLSLICHELPQSATREILAEMHRILRPGGTFAMLDMNPQSEVYRRMPPLILTLLKSTEPYLDQYFSLDMGQALTAAGFVGVEIIPVSPRHRAVIARKD